MNIIVILAFVCLVALALVATIVAYRRGLIAGAANRLTNFNTAAIEDLTAQELMERVISWGWDATLHTNLDTLHGKLHFSGTFPELVTKRIAAEHSIAMMKELT